MRPSFEKGGVFTSPCNQANGLCFGLTRRSICQNRHTRKEQPDKSLERTRER